MKTKLKPEEKGTRSARRKLTKKEKAVIIISAVLAVILILATWIGIADKALTVSRFSIESLKLPTDFDGCRIAHVSDLHNTTIGKNNKNLLSKLQKEKPDIIAITGDLIDSRKPDVGIALAFAAEAAKIAPCYYVPGNHESRVDEEYSELSAGLKALGVTVLENQTSAFKKGDSEINIFGVYDPSFYKSTISKNTKQVMTYLLDKHLHANEKFTLMLSHRPELFETYAEYPVDLVLSGHAHGGQFRLPFIGGLYAPGQGMFPEYDAGLFEKSGTSMIVSRGIGNSAFPFRIGNRPELIIIELSSATK